MRHARAGRGDPPGPECGVWGPRRSTLPANPAPAWPRAPPPPAERGGGGKERGNAWRPSCANRRGTRRRPRGGVAAAVVAPWQLRMNQVGGRGGAWPHVRIIPQDGPPRLKVYAWHALPPNVSLEKRSTSLNLFYRLRPSQPTVYALTALGLPEEAKNVHTHTRASEMLRGEHEDMFSPGGPHRTSFEKLHSVTLCIPPGPYCRQHSANRKRAEKNTQLPLIHLQATLSPLLCCLCRSCSCSRRAEARATAISHVPLLAAVNPFLSDFKSSMGCPPST